MTALSYRTIVNQVEGLYKEKGSKFISLAFPVASEAEIRELLQKTKKSYFDARHHCYAWMLGPEKKMFRANDDGEPNHSAGDPILGQIRSRDLTNVLVIVVRYFGGTKLGVGGLISAYKLATDDALAKAEIVEREVEAYFQINFSYQHTPEVMKMIKDFELRIIDQIFSDECVIKLAVTARNKNRVDQKIELLNDLGVPLIKTD